MVKPAAEVMREAIVAAVIDGMSALRAASGGVPNNLLRDLSAIHPNTTFDDLPQALQASILASVRAAFTRLQKEGYTVLNPDLAPPPRRPQPTQPSGPRGPGGPRGAARPNPSRPGQPRRPRPPGKPAR
ncbi:hypothetical protein [Sphingosinicella microcystinivorans]|uniref:Uncharacterized protein n=1 Tax=Sphingosinicella microcystinivorans TaxID=335406 RepID=A0AAD1G199_SPHMI|nr:hypothetical protein [Sphingosinicella microcystinivorans]RKS91430.1 hypothetical protein DFR51_0994 [Sphingosinicella microcystinivorans]BBE34406.1 hypothetical protein SmB9_20640 [Sphingosinicella microcystinivorans]